MLNRIALILLVTLMLPSAALAENAGASRGLSTKQRQWHKAVDEMMITLAPQSVWASAVVHAHYPLFFDSMVLPELAAVEEALYTGGLVPLPGEPGSLNLRIRTDGTAPIAEKDLAHQRSYLSARPATIGVLLDLAFRVKSGPIEVTSLVRHSGYQDDLRETNANANTSVPMHTMGLAFDVALVNTPLSRVYEIRDALADMHAAGDILVVGERRQLVFHVVPHPSRIGHYSDVYARAAAAAYAGESLSHLTFQPAHIESTVPIVETAVTGIYPTPEFAAEWWAADDVPSDILVEVHAGGDQDWLLGRMATRCVEAVADLLHTTRELFS